MAKGIAKVFGGGDIKAQQISDPFKGIKIPSIYEQQIILQNPDLMGQYTPEQQQAMQMNVSAMEGISADQGTIDSQNQALQGISEVAKGGFTEGDKAAMRESERGVNQQAQARQKAILNSMASRGVLGSGAELAAQLQGNQQSLDQAGSESNRILQAAQARSLAALGQQGSLAGQMRSQQFGEKSDVAKARDAINQFNVQNAQNVANTNVGNRNQAQMYNLQQKQSLEDQRAANANQQQTYNKQLLQTQFGNQITKAGGTAGINQAQAQANAAAQQAQAGQTGAIIGGIGTIGGAVIGGMYGGPAGAATGAEVGGALGGTASDKNLKTDIKGFDAQSFLDSLKPATYNYKDPEQFGEGKQTGVMAQDLEKTDTGKALVEDTPQGKMVDYSKSPPVLLASLVDLHNRLKELEKRK